MLYIRLRILSRKKRAFSTRVIHIFAAGAVRSQLRAAGVRQDRNVHVDVYRGSLPA